MAARLAMDGIVGDRRAPLQRILPGRAM